MPVFGGSKELVTAASVLLAVGVSLVSSTVVCAQASTQRVSVSSGGAQADDGSWSSSGLSFDGRFVVFDSYASNLIADDANRNQDVFVHDLITGTTERVSVNWSGGDPNGGSSYADISADGRFVSFHSGASNLTTGDINSRVDVFVRDLVAGQTQLVSVNDLGVEGNATSYFSSISADGRYVAFESDATNLVEGHQYNYRDIFVHDRQTGLTTCVTEGGDERSYHAAISGNGRIVAFTTRAVYFSLSPDPPPYLQKNLVPWDTNGFPDVYVYDQLTRKYERVSVDSAGAQGNGWSYHPAVSEDGRFVAFMSSASNFVPNDTNGATDVFVHDRQTGTTERVGEYVDDFEGLGRLAISDDGRYVAFASWNNGLVAGDTNGSADVFVRDRATGVLERVSRGHDGAQANDYSIFPSMSGDGQHVAFMSRATDLVPTDTNATSDVFVRTDWETVVVFADAFERGDHSMWSSAVGAPTTICYQHHDGSAESYVGLKEITPDGAFVSRFSPAHYPFSPTKAEIGWTQGWGTTSWHDYDVVFYDDDGSGGTPGTLLGTVPASAAYLPQPPLVIGTATTVGSVVAPITDGSIYVGARWNGWTAHGVSIGADQTVTSPVQASYWGDPSGWVVLPTQTIRSLFIQVCGY